jgi:hypothetical protein
MAYRQSAKMKCRRQQCENKAKIISISVKMAYQSLMKAELNNAANEISKALKMAK